MYSEPRKIVFTGLVVGAVAIGVGAYVSQSGEEWLPADDLGATHGGGRGDPAHGNTMSGVVKSAPVEGQSDSAAARASSLRAARNSLLRDDVAAARAQLNAINPAHKDDQQVLALQKEIQARMYQDQREPAQLGKAPESGETLAASPVGHPASAERNVVHSREKQLASREYSNRAPGYAKGRRHGAAGGTKPGGAVAPGVTVASAGSAGSAGAVSSAPTAIQSTYVPPVVTVPRGPDAAVTVNGLPSLQQAAPGIAQPSAQPATQRTASPAAPQPAQAVQSAPLAPQAELTAHADLPPAAGPTSVPSAPLLNSDGPKTRAQVRAEIVRAREDGHLPAFGNPDPAGPGGAPSLTILPRP